MALASGGQYSPMLQFRFHPYGVQWAKAKIPTHHQQRVANVSLCDAALTSDLRFIYSSTRFLHASYIHRTPCHFVSRLAVSLLCYRLSGPMWRIRGRQYRLVMRRWRIRNGSEAAGWSPTWMYEWTIILLFLTSIPSPHAPYFFLLLYLPDLYVPTSCPTCRRIISLNMGLQLSTSPIFPRMPSKLNSAPQYILVLSERELIDNYQIFYFYLHLHRINRRKPFSSNYLLPLSNITYT